MPQTPFVIDFHSHYYAGDWAVSQASAAPQGILQTRPLLTDLPRQLEELEAAGIDAKVLSAPSAVLVDPGQPLPKSLMKRINDRFAELIAAYPGRLYALATIDAFQGDAAADEVKRAVQVLGLQGICVDCAQGDRYLDAPEASPTLAAAAALGVPVFVHPVSPVGLTERLARLGHIGILLARGTENAASILALLRSGLFDEFPKLKIVLPMIGVAAFLFAGIADLEYEREEGWRGAAPSITRRRLSIDTMGFDPAALRFAIDVLGVDHVLLGSDWPIMPIRPRQKLEETLATLNLTEDQQAAVLGGNALRLLAPRASQDS